MMYRGFLIEKIEGTAATNWEPLWRARGGVDDMRHFSYDTHTLEQAKEWIDNKYNKLDN